MRKLFYSILFYSILITPLYALYDRESLRVEIRQEMSDTSTDTDFQKWSSTVLNERINSAQDEITNITRCIHGNTTITPTVGISTYTLPENCIGTERILYDTDASTLTIKYKELDYHTMDELDRDHLGWEYASSGCPVGYWYDQNYVGFYPAPGLLYVGYYGNGKIYYQVRATSMTADTDIPFQGYRHLYPYHKIIVWYVCALCAHDEGDTAKESLYWGKFDRDIAIMVDRLNSFHKDRKGSIVR